MWENCYYKGGYDDGVLDTPAGKVGVALCWELVRTRTLRRLIDKVDLVVGGSCWWDLPDNFVGEEADAARADNLNRLKETPSQFAKILGVPVVHASHAGEFDGFNPLFKFKTSKSACPPLCRIQGHDGRRQLYQMGWPAKAAF